MLESNHRKYIIYIVFLSIFVHIVKIYHEHYHERAEYAKSAKLYLNSDVCKKAELRVKLGKWQRCAESKYELRLSPFLRALYDTLEDCSLCGHKRCEALVTWMQSYKYFIIAFLCFTIYSFYEFYKWQQQMNMVNRFMGSSLPGAGLLVN